MADSTKGSATPDREGSILLGSQRGSHQDSADNKGAGVLDLPGDLAASGQAIGTTSGTVGNSTGGQASTSEVTGIFAGQQITTDQVSGRGHRVTFGVRPKSGGMEAHHELVQEGVRGIGPIVEGEPGPYYKGEGRYLQVQTTGGDLCAHPVVSGRFRIWSTRETGYCASGEWHKRGESGRTVGYVVRRT